MEELLPFQNSTIYKVHHFFCQGMRSTRCGREGRIMKTCEAMWIWWNLDWTCESINAFAAEALKQTAMLFLSMFPSVSSLRSNPWKLLAADWTWLCLVRKSNALPSPWQQQFGPWYWHLTAAFCCHNFILQHFLKSAHHFARIWASQGDIQLPKGRCSIWQPEDFGRLELATINEAPTLLCSHRPYLHCLSNPAFWLP